MIVTDGGGMRPINDALTKLMRERDAAEARAEASEREVARLRLLLDQVIDAGIWMGEAVPESEHARLEHFGHLVSSVRDELAPPTAGTPEARES